MGDSVRTTSVPVMLLLYRPGMGKSHPATLSKWLTMSAANWAICPKCLKNATKKYDALVAKARKSYGKVSLEAYTDLIAEIPKPARLKETLREDYELGIEDNGMFIVIYRASCSVCDFKFEFRHSESCNKS